MKRSMQEVVELVIFALIALLVGTGVVWLAGWMLGLVGTVLTWLAGLVWSLLRFLVPIAVVAGAVYLLVKLMNRSAERVAGEPQKQPATPPSPWTMSKEPQTAPADDEETVAGAETSASAAASDAPEPSGEAAATTPHDVRKPSPGVAGEPTDEPREGSVDAGEQDVVRDEGYDAGGESDEEEDDDRRHGGQPS